MVVLIYAPDVLRIRMSHEPTDLESLTLKAVHTNCQLLKPKEWDMPEDIFQRFQDTVKAVI